MVPSSPNIAPGVCLLQWEPWFKRLSPNPPSVHVKCTNYRYLFKFEQIHSEPSRATSIRTPLGCGSAHAQLVHGQHPQRMGSSWSRSQVRRLKGKRGRKPHDGGHLEVLVKWLGRDVGGWALGTGDGEEWAESWEPIAN